MPENLEASLRCSIADLYLGRCLQGAAFDVRQEIADQMMKNVEELTKRGFELDIPASLPEEPYRGGGMRGGRSGLVLPPLLVFLNILSPAGLGCLFSDTRN